MFNRSEIMKAAWAQHRRALSYVASNPYLAGTVVRFADSLKDSWRRAKAAVARLIRPAAISARIDALKASILDLDCRSFRYRIGGEREALANELASIEREYA